MKIMVSTVLMVLMVLMTVMTGSGVWAHSEEGHVCFTEVDANGDEKVTPEEFKKVYGTKGVPFSEGDENEDGYLDHDEYESMLEGSS